MIPTCWHCPSSGVFRVLHTLTRVRGGSCGPIHRVGCVAAVLSGVSSYVDQYFVVDGVVNWSNNKQKSG